MKRKLSLAVLPLVSVTVTVMKEFPVRPGAGLTVTLRLEALPPKTTLAAGTRAVLVEVAESVSSAAGVCPSPMRKGTTGEGWPTSMIWFGMSAMTGGVSVGGGGAPGVVPTKRWVTSPVVSVEV